MTVHNLNRLVKSRNLAIGYARRALKVNQNNGFAYCTMAEAYAMMGQDEEFYQHAESALKLEFPVWEYLDEFLFERYIQQERFRNLIRKYRQEEI